MEPQNDKKIRDQIAKPTESQKPNDWLYLGGGALVFSALYVVLAIIGLEQLPALAGAVVVGSIGALLIKKSRK